VSYDHKKQLSLAKKFSQASQQSTATMQLEQRNRDEKTNAAEIKNAAMMAKHMGKQYPLHYNDKVQLQHMKSSKFLTLQENSVAELDPMCLKLFLSEGTEGSLFAIMGLYKIQIAGSPVFSAPPLQLLNCRLGDHYLHATKKVEASDAEGGRDALMRLEADLSTKQGHHDGWTLHPYQQHSEDDLEHMQMGQPVALLHSEEEKYVCCGGDTVNPDHDDALDATKDLSTLKIYFVFESPEQGDNKLKGGKLKWATPYRMRHMASGHYLSAGVDGKVQMRQLKGTDADPSSFLFALTPTQHIAGTHQRGAYVRLFEVRQSGCRVENHAGGKKSYLHKIEGSEKFGLRSTMHEMDGYCIAPLPEADTPELYRVGSFIRATEEYLAAYTRPHDTAAIERNQKHFLDVLKSVNAWLCDSDRDDIQQDVIRDLFLDALMWALLGPFLYKLNIDDDENDNGSGGQGSPSKAANFRHLTEEDELPTQLLNVQRLLCDVMKAAIRGNSRSQLYFAQKRYSSSWLSPALEQLAKTKLRVSGGTALWEFAHQESNDRWVEALTNQLAWRAGVGGIFVCMVENNYDVLRNHVEEKLIFNFVQWMRKKGPFAQWLNVLSVICICDGQRVPQQQEGVLRMLLSAKDFEGKIKPDFADSRTKLVIETILDNSPQHRRPYAPTTDVADFLKKIGKDETATGEDMKAPASLYQMPLMGVSEFDDPNVKATIAVPASSALKYPQSMQSHVEAGVHYFDVKGSSNLAQFEQEVVSGVAHLVPSKFSGGFEFRELGNEEMLGKQMYLQGFSRILVGFMPGDGGDSGEPNIFTKVGLMAVTPVYSHVYSFTLSRRCTGRVLSL
jgi:hypothetical protein